MAWLCQCGNGNLVEDPPEYCGLCGFPLREYFDALEQEEEDVDDDED